MNLSESLPGAAIRQKILIVDDSPENLVALEAVLESLGQEIIRASSGFEALRQCLEHDFAAILLDVKMPGMDGFETASMIRSRKRSQHTPILFLTGFRNDEHLFRGYDLGAVDFLFKPIVAEVLQSKVSVFVELSRNNALLRSQAEEIRNLNIGLERKISERTAQLMEDIAERKKAEEALRESEQRLRVAMDAANLGLWSIIPKDGQISATPRTRRAFGFGEQASADYRDWLKRIVKDDRSDVLGSFRKALISASDFDCEFRVQGGDKLRWVACRGRLLHDTGDSPPRLVGVLQDVTERKMADEIVRHKHKLESLGVLAGGIAHDFNNLLTGVLGHASLVLEDPAIQGENRQCIESVVLAAESAAQLTRQMLAYSGRGRFVVEPMHLSTLVRDLQPLLQAALPKSVRMELDLADALPNVEVDTAQLHQLILNLVMNAAEAVNPERGLLQVCTREAELTEEVVRHAPVGREAPLGRYVVLEVRDNGHGMDEVTLSKIFDPFFTTKFTGRGLGLAAALGIVQGHKGAIHVQSEPGKGTIFTVYFPPTASIVERRMTQARNAKELGNGVVLVVDDEEVIRSTAKLCLERHGFSVALAKDGQECIELMAQKPDRFDLVLLDMAMPVMGGAEAFQTLLRIWPQVPVIATSGYDESETVAKFGEGLAGFLKKPYTAAQLADKIKEITGRRANRLAVIGSDN